MKRFLLAIAVIIAGQYAQARDLDIDVDNDIVNSNLDDNDINLNIDADSAAVVLEQDTCTIFVEDTDIADNTEMVQEEEKTYRNWLGETCIDFGNDHSLYYNWKRDLTYSGIPLFLSSFIIKDKKRAFRSARFSLDQDWKTEIDNYTQFSPYAVVVGLKALGYQGRSSWDRLMSSALLSNAVMAVAVNATKYSVKEMRPDNSTRNSFPSGHTATAFVAATVLHKEYGLTRSPWFSVGGYAVAMGTGFMRVLNNRHWISDVMAGAGIGILSTELGYFLGDIFYKNKGITRRELVNPTNPNHPSFFDIQMGIGMHSKFMEAKYDDGDYHKLELGTSTAVGVEGAYFFNKYIGIGGMARVTTTPIKGLGLNDEEIEAIAELNNDMKDLDLPCLYNVKTSNSNLIDGSFDIGVYGNLPLSKHFSLGAKALVGVRVNGGFEYTANVGYAKTATDDYGNDIYTTVYDFEKDDFIRHEPVFVFENADGTTFNSNEMLQPGVTREYNYHLDPQRFQSGEYSFIKLTGGSSFNYVFGLSATYRYKENFSWKIFLDYDSAKNNYNYKLKLFNDLTMDYLKNNAEVIYNNIKDEIDYTTSFKAKLNLFTLGAAFSINF